MVAVTAPLPGRAAAPSDEPRASRLRYLDNLKTVLVVGVIAAHAATHYIGGGEWVKHAPTVKPTLITLFGVLGLAGGLFWIGLFFLIAGFLAPASLAHHGPKHFLHDRLIRLGVPLIAYVLVVMPLVRYAIYRFTYSGRGVPDSLAPWVGGHIWPLDAGPLWFVADLLLFSVAHVLWWRFRPRRTVRSGPLRVHHLIILVVAIAVPSFLLHLMWPLFTRQFLDLHLSQWPQFVTLYWFGAVSAERGWLAALSSRLWKQCGMAAVVAALAVPVVGIAGGALSGNTTLITGGWHWEALVTAGIEGVIAVCGSLWMLEFFRRRLDRQPPAARRLSRCSYGAYVVHEPLLIAVALALRPLELPVEVSFLILAPVAVTASFAAARLLLQLPLVGRIL